MGTLLLGPEPAPALCPSKDGVQGPDAAPLGAGIPGGGPMVLRVGGCSNDSPWHSVPVGWELHAGIHVLGCACTHTKRTEHANQVVVS